jgi:putative ABC transport system ATP-binding protein
MTSTGLHIETLRSDFAGPVALDVAGGCCAAITGPSGSGKSLLLRMIADLDSNHGEVSLDGRRRAAMPAPEWRKQVIYLSAESGWWTDIVGSHFAQSDRPAAIDLMQQLGVRPTAREAQVIHLSTGEKQRMALIRALVKAPRVLLLDEPTAALDHDSVERVEAVLSAFLSRGGLLVLVTHDPDQAVRLGTERYHMNAGRLEPA